MQVIILETASQKIVEHHVCKLFHRSLYQIRDSTTCLLVIEKFVQICFRLHDRDNFAAM